MNIPRVATAVALCSFAVTGAAACSSSHPPAPPRTDVHSSAPAATQSAQPASEAISAAPSPRAVGRPRQPRTSSAPPAPSGASTSAVAGPADCANGTVGVSAQRGGALPGEEVALLVFTNQSSSDCTITGFPGVELFAHGNVIGKPATRSTMAVRALTVAPGAQVTAVLHDDTRCNADLSDQVGVYVPNQTAQERIALELRACALTIDPVRR